MTRAFHHLSKVAIAVSLVTCGLMSVAQTKTTINAVMHSPLRVLDPIITTAHITRNHGYMIYDTLLATDKDNKIRPQMVQDWKASDDGRTYTFKLRDGLKWHDGAAVTAEDCVASIKDLSEN